MKKIFLENILPGIVTLLLGTFIGIYVNSKKEVEDNKKRFLDYSLSIYPYLVKSPEEDLTSDVKVFYKEKSINNLTLVEVSLYNLSDKDFEDIPLYVTLFPALGDSLEIVRSNFTSYKNMPDIVESKEISTTDLSKKFEYKIKTANRSASSNIYTEENLPIIKASYLIIGAKNPKVELTLNKKGLDIRPWDYLNYSASSPSMVWVILFVLLAFVLLFFVFIFTIKIINFFSRNKAERDLIKRKQFILTNLLDDEIIKEQKWNIVDKIFKLNIKYSWDKASKLERFMGEVIKPVD